MWPGSKQFHAGGAPVAESVQAPRSQLRPGAQACPHPPQLAVSRIQAVWSTHSPRQQAPRPPPLAWQLVAAICFAQLRASQCPDRQSSPWSQAISQRPQLALSADRSTQRSPQQLPAL